MASQIAIIGANVAGATAAYALLRESVCDEILLVDTKVDRRDGQIRDLCDAASCQNSSTRIRAGTHHEAAQSDIVVITAASKKGVGETSTETLYRHTAIIHSIINSMKPSFRPDTILLVVSTPVDILTTLAQELSGLPKCQVFGSGTFLDSARIRRLLAHKFRVPTTSVDAYVLGEHGESQFVAWSSVLIDRVALDKVAPPSTFNRNELAEECKHEAQRIIKAKGAIGFGIGSIVASICDSVLLDKREVRPVSHFQPSLGCCLSLPAVLGREGVLETVSLSLNTEEKAQLAKSGRIVKEAVQGLDEWPRL